MVPLHRAAHLAAQQVARGRLACMPLGHDKPEPTRRHSPVIHRLWARLCSACGQLGLGRCRSRSHRDWLISQMMGCEVSTSRLRGCCKHGFEFSRSPQAAEHRAGCRTDSDRQALAPFGAPRLDHRAAAAALHANQKAVRACAVNLGGLIGAFHLGWSSAASNIARDRDEEYVTNCAAWRSGPERGTPRPALSSGADDASTSLLASLFGKPRIKAKTPFSVKHLHGRSRLGAPIDAGDRTVDNRAWRKRQRPSSRRSKTTCPQ